MKHYVLILSLAVLLGSCSKKVLKSYAEEADIRYEESGNNDISNACCTESINYAPDEAYPEHFPMKYLKVNFHFVFDDKDSQRLSDEFYERYAKMQIRKCNYRLSKNAKMELPPGNDTPVLPIPYRYVLDDRDGNGGLYFHSNSDLNYFNKDMRGKNSMTKPDQYNELGVHKKEVLNVFFMEHHPDSIASKTYKASACGISGGHWVKIAALHQKWKNCKDTETPYHCIANKYFGLINHEIGHALGLGHTWKYGDGCDDTPKNENCFNVNYPNKPECDSREKVSNNMMDYNSLQSAITPCQLGKIYYNMSKDRGRQRPMLDDRWCRYDSEASISIPPEADLEWPSARDLSGDLILEAGSRLVIRCKVSLPKGAKVIVKPGAELVLNSGKLYNDCDEEWEGVELWKQGREKGRLVIQNAGKIENVRDDALKL